MLLIDFNTFISTTHKHNIHCQKITNQHSEQLKKPKLLQIGLKPILQMIVKMP
jgi:hypothetical protein